MWDGSSLGGPQFIPVVGSGLYTPVPSSAAGGPCGGPYDPGLDG